MNATSPILEAHNSAVSTLEKSNEINSLKGTVVIMGDFVKQLQKNTGDMATSIQNCVLKNKETYDYAGNINHVIKDIEKNVSKFTQKTQECETGMASLTAKMTKTETNITHKVKEVELKLLDRLQDVQVTMSYSSEAMEGAVEKTHSTLSQKLADLDSTTRHERNNIENNSVERSRSLESKIEAIERKTEGLQYDVENYSKKALDLVNNLSSIGRKNKELEGCVETMGKRTLQLDGIISDFEKKSQDLSRHIGEVGQKAFCIEGTIEDFTIKTKKLEDSIQNLSRNSHDIVARVSTNSQRIDRAEEFERDIRDSRRRIDELKEQILQRFGQVETDFNRYATGEEVRAIKAELASSIRKLEPSANDNSSVSSKQLLKSHSHHTELIGSGEGNVRQELEDKSRMIEKTVLKNVLKTLGGSQFFEGQGLLAAGECNTLFSRSHSRSGSQDRLSEAKKPHHVQPSTLSRALSHQKMEFQQKAESGSQPVLVQLQTQLSEYARRINSLEQNTDAIALANSDLRRELQSTSRQDLSGKQDVSIFKDEVTELRTRGTSGLQELERKLVEVEKHVKNRIEGVLSDVKQQFEVTKNQVARIETSLRLSNSMEVPIITLSDQLESNKLQKQIMKEVQDDLGSLRRELTDNMDHTLRTRFAETELKTLVSLRSLEELEARIYSWVGEEGKTQNDRWVKQFEQVKTHFQMIEKTAKTQSESESTQNSQKGMQNSSP